MTPGRFRSARRRCCGASLSILFCATLASAQDASQPLRLLDVPYISQTEALCGGAAGAMILRYWGARGLTAESFAHLVDPKAAGIRTTALSDDIKSRGWNVVDFAGTEDAIRAELVQARPVLALIEDRPGTFHYIVIVGWHERGVVFHDPARAPFRVMSRTVFERRWAVAHRWMAVITPGAETDGSGGRTAETPPAPPPSSVIDAATTCDQLVADGIRQAGGDDVAAAERSFSAALGCPGPAPLRELAGVRVLQRRWNEAEDLAVAALREDSKDPYTWRLLATSRFLQDDQRGALDAWNQVGEPKIDLVRIDGLSRTTHRVGELTLGIRPGDVLTVRSLTRARRRLSELPSAASTRLDYAPVPSGLVELRASVAERELLPHGRFAAMALGLSAAANREVSVTSASLTGNGERVTFGWRFWRQRPRTAIRFDVPAPWGGVFGLDAFSERQGFVSDRPVSDAERNGARLLMADWASGRVRWNAGAGIDSWKPEGTFGSVHAGVRLVSTDDRADASVRLEYWTGRHSFALSESTLRIRSSTAQVGTVFSGSLGVRRASSATPLVLWFAGDTGQARSSLLRGHPVLDDGRLRVSQLGRILENATIEGQRWWRLFGPARLAAAGFLDLARTSGRIRGDEPLTDVDVGLGTRLALTGMPGVFRVDFGKGLRDGAAALSFVYDATAR